MTATIDSAGRIVIPKAVRNAAHLEPGTKVRVQVTPSGRVEIEPEPLSVALERSGRFTVAIPRDRRPVLKQTDVDRAVAAIRAGG
ncbi:MAG: AbrB/MazE/SpoVT family DNA-binding domain-containing protein [Bryobacterales bacterium]|nr:AbrB/MazE/SpoVT family DNA-binding domain-containing protein [Bryobacterales bacterium]